MDWNKLVVIIANLVLFVGLLVAVCLGHNAAITDALLAVSGSITGIGLVETVRKAKK